MLIGSRQWCTQIIVEPIWPMHQNILYIYTHRLRLIAGDLCKNTSASVKLLRFEQKICTGHEKDSGNIDTTDKVGLL